MLKHVKRMKVVAAMVLAGGIATQFGGCTSSLVSGGLAVFDFCAILGPDCRIGPIAPCGRSTYDGSEQDFALAVADDLLVDCPAPTVAP